MAAQTVQGSGNFLSGQMNQIPTEFTSSGRDIFLRFTSDDSQTRSGFLIEYEQGKIMFLNVEFFFMINSVDILKLKNQYMITKCTFYLKYIAVADVQSGDPGVDPCGNQKPLIIDEESDDYAAGNITTPNFPEDYPAFSDCQWEMHASDGDAISIDWMEFSTEYG